MPGVLSGLIPACHTPFHRDGRLNLATVERQAELFRESGLKGVFVGGTTGEFASLSVQERQALCDRWMDVAGDSLRIAVHAGHNCRADAIALAAHARGAGAAAVAAMSPSFFKPASVDDLIEFLVPIAAEADPLPFYYYHIPSMTGVRLSASEFLHEARFRIPNLRGLKYSHDDLVDLQKCVASDGGAFDVLFGCDEVLLAGLCLGARGAVGSTYNFAAPHYRRIMRALEAGDLAAAREAQLQAAQLVTTLAGFGFSAASKAVMALIGVDCGPVRAPLRNLSSSELAVLADELAACRILARAIEPTTRVAG
jgi:N-acetylneuraminate lyase